MRLQQEFPSSSRETLQFPKRQNRLGHWSVSPDMSEQTAALLFVAPINWHDRVGAIVGVCLGWDLGSPDVLRKAN